MFFMNGKKMFGSILKEQLLAQMMELEINIGFIIWMRSFFVDRKI